MNFKTGEFLPRFRHIIGRNSKVGIFSRMIKAAAFAIGVAALPMTAQAVTVTVDDLGVGVGAEASISGPTSASLSGTFGGFDVAIASGSIATTANSAILNSTSIQTSGVGTLQITVEETGLTGFSTPTFGLVGVGSTTIGSSVMVEHFINLGGGFMQIGADILLSGLDTGHVSDVFASAPFFDLRTVITVMTTSGSEFANVNATLTAAVPLPAAGLLLLGGLGGLVMVRRRRKAA